MVQLCTELSFIIHIDNKSNGRFIKRMKCMSCKLILIQAGAYKTRKVAKEHKKSEQP